MTDTTGNKPEAGEELSPEEFNRYLNDSLTARDSFSPGDSVSGTVVFITGDSVFVDISGKTEAVIDASEFRDARGTLTIKKGDTIKAFVASINRGEITLTSRLGRGAMNPILLETARMEHMPVQGVPTAVVKGGYTVMVGDTRCFCPLSQIALKVPEKPEDYLHRSMEFLVTRIEENGRNIVLSRRALLEEKRQQDMETLKKSLHEGDVVNGTVTSIQNFGIFVDIGGVEALIPRSEISRGRNTGTGSFTPGQEVQGRILSLSWDEKRIVLSLKAMEADPWDTITRYAPGQVLTGMVVNLISQGVFVELESGLEGFVPVSRMSVTQKVNRPEDIVKKGDHVQVRISSINPGEKKIGLELVTGEVDPWTSEDPQFESSTHSAFVETAKPNGLQIRLGNGMAGFVPKEELANRGDFIRAYPSGTTLTLAVKDFDRGKRRLIMSEVLAAKRAEEGEYKSFQKSQESASGNSLGSQFGDKLAALKKKLEEKSGDGI